MKGRKQRNRFIAHCRTPWGARGGAVGWGTALQAGRSWVRFPITLLEFFINLLLLALRSTQPLTEMSTRNISWRVKVVGAWGWQSYHLYVLSVLKSCLEPSGPLQGLLYLYLYLTRWTFYSFIDKVAYSEVHSFVYHNLPCSSPRLPFILGHFVSPIKLWSCIYTPPRRLHNSV